MIWVERFCYAIKGSSGISEFPGAINAELPKRPRGTHIKPAAEREIQKKALAIA